MERAFRTDDHTLVILCVDDEKIVLNSLRTQLKRMFDKQNYEVMFAESAEEALEIIDELEEENKMLALIVSDQIMPGMKGDELLIEVHKRLPETLKVLLTGQTSFEAIQNAINNASLYRFINKPWDPEDFMLTISQACKSYEQKIRIDSYDAQIKLLQNLNLASQEIANEINLEILCRKFFDELEKLLEPDLIELVLEKEDIPDKYYHLYRTTVEDEITRIQKATEKSFLKPYCQNFCAECLQNQSVAATFVKSKSIQLGLKYSKTGAYQGFLLLKYSDSSRSFNDKELEIVRILTGQASLSIENARLFNELKNTVQDISDSINYAKRIQVSLLPPKGILEDNFKESFLFYRPRNVVSGDFYWFAQNKDFYYVAVVDCTGHGVPGAFMSILGNSELNKIVNDLCILETNEILTILHKIINSNLDLKTELDAANSNTIISDGMDVALCRISKQNFEIQFSGANRPLVRMSRDGITEYSTDKFSIGPSNKRSDVFSAISFQPEWGDTIFLFSDGVTDQFGGELNRKLTKKKLIDFFITNKDLPLSTQCGLFNTFMDGWIRENQQTDDMTLIGFRV